MPLKPTPRSPANIGDTTPHPNLLHSPSFPTPDPFHPPPRTLQSNWTNPPMNTAMLSEARQTANAANACLSTGPRTGEGKARSSQNARKHGLTAAQLVIAPEDRQEFDELLAQLQTEIRPEGVLQQILFDRLVASAWNLNRILCMEAKLTASAGGYLDILDHPELTAKLDRLARHQSRIERSFHRSLRELKSLQTDAALAPTLPPAFMRTAPPLASKTQIAKRTQALALADRQNGSDEDYWCGPDAEAAALRAALENYERPQTEVVAAT